MKFKTTILLSTYYIVGKVGSFFVDYNSKKQLCKDFMLQLSLKAFFNSLYDRDIIQGIDFFLKKNDHKPQEFKGN